MSEHLLFILCSGISEANGREGTHSLRRACDHIKAYAVSLTYSHIILYQYWKTGGPMEGGHIWAKPTCKKAGWTHAGHWEMSLLHKALKTYSRGNHCTTSKIVRSPLHHHCHCHRQEVHRGKMISNKHSPLIQGMMARCWMADGFSKLKQRESRDGFSIRGTCSITVPPFLHPLPHPASQLTPTKSFKTISPTKSTSTVSL